MFFREKNRRIISFAKVTFYSNETAQFPQASKKNHLKKILRIISDMFTLSETNIYALKTWWFGRGVRPSISWKGDSPENQFLPEAQLGGSSQDL